MKMNWEKSILFTLLLGAMILSCKQDGTIDAKSSVQQFFDLKGYFKAEAQRLKAKGRVTKFVTADGKTEERVIDSVDFQRELDFFAGSDINRPAWSDKYVVDTLFNKQQEVIQLSYECNDEHLKIRKIVVGFDNSVVNKILIENNTSNSIATSNQVLVYQPSIGYSIESHQKVAISDEQLFRVEVRF